MNLFEKIISPEARQMFSQTGQAVKTAVAPITQIGKQAIQSVAPITQTFGQAGKTIAKPYVENYDYAKKLNQYYSPYRESINKLGLTAEDFAEIPEDKKETILNGLREIGVTIPELPKPKSTDPMKNADLREGFIENIGGGIMDVVGGVVAEVPKIAGETASFLSKAGGYTPSNILGTAIKAGFSDKTYGQLREEQKAEADRLAGYGQKGKELVQEYGAYDPTSTASKVGGFGAEVGSTLIGPNKVGILKKGADTLKAGKKLATAGKIGDIALEGGLAGAKYDVASKGKITPESVGVGALANVGVAGAIKGIGKTYQYATRKLPASLTLGGLINPGKLDVVKKGLMVDEGVATPEDVGKWILDRVKPGNKQEIADQLIQHAEKTKGAVDEALASMPEYYKNNEAKKALMQIRNELEGKVGLEGRISQIDDMLAKPEYTLSELNAVKRELDNMYNMYTKTGDPTAGLKAEGLRNIRANIRKFIEDKADDLGVDIRKLNNETSTARGLADGILRKDSADGVRELLTAFAPSGAGAVIGAGQSMARGEDPLTVLRDAVIGGVATRVATSTAVRTRVASALNKLAPKELSALENYIRSGGKDAIGKKVAEKVIREGRALPARTITKEGDFAKPTEKSIITPQTQERAIIQESKTGLGSNVKRPNGNTNNTSNNNRNIPVGNDRGLTPVTPTPVKKVTPKKITPTEKVEPKKVETVNEQPYGYEAKRTEQAVNKMNANTEYEKASKGIGAEIINDVDIPTIQKLYDKKITENDITERIQAIRDIKGSIAYANAKHIENKKLTNAQNWSNWTKIFNERLQAPNNTGVSKVPKLRGYNVSYDEFIGKPRTIKDPTKTTVNLQQSKGGFIRLPEIGKKSVKNPLVEEARKPIKGVNFTKLKGLIENIKSNNGGQKGVLGDFLEGSEMKKIYGDALDTPIYIFDEKHPVFKTAENINKEGTPRAMTAFIEGGKVSNKGTPIIAIRGKISVDGLIKTLTEEGMHALQKLKGRKRIGSATAKNFSEYEGNANEINANKGAAYAMKIINRK